MPNHSPDNPIAKIKALIKEKTKAKVANPQFWKPAGLINRISPSRKVQNWLKTATSLTAKLRHLCPNLEVIVLSEKYEVPLLSEAQKLNLKPDEEAWVRCVVLKCHDQHLIYARTIIPAMSSTNPWHELQQLGNKPLGEILFEMPKTQRSDFEFSKDLLSLWPYLNCHLNNTQENKKFAYARRSVFEQKGAPLLLTEVFLPQLIEN